MLEKTDSFRAERPDGGTGRRAGLKIRFSQESGSSTLPLGTIFICKIMAQVLF